MGDEADQDAVEQIDMFGPEAAGPLQKQFGDASRRVGTAFGIVTPDDFLEPGDQRCRESHQTLLKPAALTGFRAI